MKREITVVALTLTSIMLSHCASMVNQGETADRSGTRKIVGDTGLYRGTEDCPNGGILALLKESNAGTVELLARGVISASPIEDNLDVYEIAEFRHTGYDPDHDYSKVKISPLYRDLAIKFTGDETTEGQGDEVKQVGLDEKFSMVLKGNVLEASGGTAEGLIKTSFSLSESKGKDVAKTMQISPDGSEYKSFALPTPILGETVSSFGMVSATKGGKMAFKIEPSSNEGSVLYVQWNNQKPGRKGGVSYETVLKEIPANGEIEVSVDDTPVGSYKMYVSRIRLGKTELGDATICVDAGATVVSKLTVAEQEKEK